jgi:hypothetical protein
MPEDPGLCYGYASLTCDRCSDVQEVLEWICECKQGVSCLTAKFRGRQSPRQARSVGTTLSLHLCTICPYVYIQFSQM